MDLVVGKGDVVFVGRVPDKQDHRYQDETGIAWEEWDGEVDAYHFRS